MVVEEIKFGKCPFCESREYSESISEFVNCYGNPYVIMDTYCNDCEKSFTTYYSQDEVKFDDENGEEQIYNNSLSKDDKEVLLKAINLLIDQEGDTNDYTRIIKVLNGELNRE